MAFAVYRIPGSEKTTLVKGMVKRSRLNDEQADGFYINVFSTNEVFWIEPALVLQGNTFTALADEWQKEMYLRPGTAVKENLESEYEHTLRNAIDAVEEGAFKKLVISRNQKVLLHKPAYAAILDELAKAFPECLVYIFSTPHTGTWLGATPEKLLVKKNDRYQTMALAGTIRSSEPVHNSHWGDKEREEQRLVEEYIGNIIGAQGYAFSKSEVFTLKTGLLYHLCTGFDIEPGNRKKLLALANRLHPTPAVAGLPAKESVHFIKSNEKYLRECYTGYLGPLGILNEDVLYVNLRCCQLVDDGAVFYAGGGINKGSVAEKEKTEVANKLKNLRRFFAGG